MIRLLSVAAALAILAIGGFMSLGAPGQPGVSSGPLIGAAHAQDAGEVDTSTIAEMALGDENAPVTVVEYASYTCPHCADYHEGPFRKLKSEYIDTGKVRFIYREVYFDRYGLWASMVARCEPAKFFGITDLIYKSQKDWVRAGGPAEIVAELKKIGRLAGMDDATLDACLQDANKAQTLVAWYQEHAKADGIEGTPSFIVNGKKVENQPWADFKAIIDAELDG
ncbi:MAG: DsbA family protein [Rhodobacteraceae bacterium]|nr:DsbA family protein [Paracoccaceae bacterium]